MLLYIKQRVFSFTDKYNVYNENLEPVYEVESEFFSFLSKIHLYDLQGREIFYIKKRLTFIFAEYEIYSGDTLYAVVKQEFSLLKPKLTVTSTFGDFDINGEFFAMDFDISCNGNSLGRITKEWISFGDSYRLDIYNPKDAGFFTALVIAIDNCLHNDKSHHHHNHNN